MVGKDQLEDAGENIPMRHAADMLDDVIQHCRDSIGRISEAKGQALFETAAEVLIGLRTAFQHYEAGKEAGFRR